MDETEYLLSSKANKKHLLDAIKSKKFTRFTPKEFEEYSKQLIKSKPMKDKFEEIIERECFVYLGQGKEKSIKHAAERCNTLHQQAMKEERARLMKKIKGLACKECMDTPELNGGIVKDSDCDYNDALFTVLELIKKHYEKDNT